MAYRCGVATVVPTAGYSKATAHDHSSTGSKIDILLNCNENFIQYSIIITYLLTK